MKVQMFPVENIINLNELNSDEEKLNKVIYELIIKDKIINLNMIEELIQKILYIYRKTGR